MPVVVCPACAKKLHAPDAAAGKSVRCPGCGQAVPVPALAATLSPVPTPARPPVGEPTVAHSVLDLVDEQSQQGTHGRKEDPDKTHGSPEAASTPTQKFTEFLAPPQGPDELGRLGPYRVLKILGRGGMGVVFLAEDVKLQRMVALKVMLPKVAEHDAAGQRFLREARTMAQVKHPHVATIYQVDEDRGVPYLAMEFLEGESLEDCLQRAGKLPIREVVRLGREIAEGLHAAHKRGLIHRDIKPGNIWLEHQGSGVGGQGSGTENQALSLAPDSRHLTPRCHVKILDFGLARSGDEDSHLTQTGVIVGTPAYMAPEQGRGEAVDARCDLFSLGVVLYRLCTGDMPFKASNAVSTLMAVASHQPRAPQLLNAAVPSELSDLIMKLLAKDPQDRCASAQALAEALAALPAAPVETREMLRSSEPSSQPALRSEPTLMEDAAHTALVQPRSRWPLLGLALVGIPLILAAIVYFWPTGNGKIGGEKWVKGEEASIAPGGPWRQLFNGKDLTGWMQPPLHKCDWKVVDGLLTAEGGHGVLFTEKMQPQDFHLRAEVKISARGDSGVFFRAQFPNFGTRSYEANIGTPAAGGEALNRWSGQRQTWKATKPQPVEEWFKLEIIAQGAHLQVLQNGETVVDVTDPQPFIEDGHVGLQHFHADTGIWFRKVEIKDLSLTPRRYQNALGMEFALVPKGKAWLGGGGGKPGDKEVEIKDDFYLGVYEVTQEEWEKVMGKNPSYFSRQREGSITVKDISDASLRRFPVESVSWDDCQSFIAKLNERTMESGWAYQFPSRDQWGYACRGGPMTDRADSAFDYYLDRPTSKLTAADSNFKDTNLQRPRDVGSYKPNKLGLHDMHGNVAEWCSDSWDGNDPIKTFVSGGWMNVAGDCHPNYRYAAKRSEHFPHVGLRLARIRVDADPDRRAAAWVLSIGGGISIKENDQERQLGAAADLPKGPFDLTGVTLTSNAKVSDAGLANFKDCKNLTSLDLAATKVSDAGLVHFKDCKNLASLVLRHAPLSDAGLVHFVDCKNLTILDLNDTKVSDAGLAYFKNCKNLTGLHLAGTQVSDAGLAYFEDCKNLTSLELGSTQVSDAGLAHFKDRKNLTLLVLNGTKISDAGLDYFKDCKNLTGLHLWATKASDAGLDYFKDCKNLTSLNLGSTKVSDTGLVSLKDCKNLTRLDLTGTKVSDAGLANLAGCPNLGSLSVQNTKVTEAGVKKLAAALPLCKIEWDGGVIEPKQALDPDRRAAQWVLSIGGTLNVTENGKERNTRELPAGAFDLTAVILQFNPKVTDAGLAHFKDCKNLTTLDLSGTKSSDAGLANFKDCKNITWLSLGGTQVSNAGLAYFKDCKNLTNLVLSSTQVSDAGLAYLKDCKNLWYLRLAYNQVNDAGLAHLKDCKNLGLLDLRFTQVSDTGLAHLKDCKNLHELNLSSTKANDAGLAHLKDCKNLVGLYLDGTQVSDAGLEGLSVLAKLGFVNVTKTKVTVAGVKKLSAALPLCKIEWDGGVIQPQSKNRFTNPLGMKFALIPKGKAWLGGGGGGKPGDKEVEFKDDFYLGVYEVTQEEWREVMNINPSSFSRTGDSKILVQNVTDDELKRFPVEMISWTDAQAFIDKLNKRDEQAGWIYRLPTTAEWEYACRGGPIAKSDSAFHFYFEKATEECPPAQANVGNHLMRPTKVGSYPPNRLGLHDMHGNVWEWCQDAPEGTRRILRGAGWQDLAQSAQAAASITHDESTRFFSTGLRVARVPR